MNDAKAGNQRLRAPFTVKAIDAWETPGRFCDRDGLYLQVTTRQSGEGVTKAWLFKYRDRATGKTKELGLGSLGKVNLAEARRKAAELRRLLDEGKDPKSEKLAKRLAVRTEAAKAFTFDEATAACIADRRAGWRNAKHADQWANTLATYASPYIGKLPVSDIDLALVRKVLDPIWTTKNETASRVRQRIEAVLNWATVSGYRKGENPARWRGHLDHLLPKPSKVQKKKHHAALPFEDTAQFVSALRERAGVAALALEFTILTVARTGEVIGATWKEFDLEKRLWIIPAERMKAGQEHTVPLSHRALEILKSMQQTQLGDFVFPGGKKGAPLSNMAMATVLKRMNRSEITVHGFRSAFRDWAGETTNFPVRIIEHALAHQLKDKAEAAYSRGTMIEKRRRLMDAWATFCGTPRAKVANVVPIRSAQ